MFRLYNTILVNNVWLSNYQWQYFRTLGRYVFVFIAYISALSFCNSTSHWAGEIAYLLGYMDFCIALKLRSVPGIFIIFRFLWHISQRCQKQLEWISLFKNGPTPASFSLNFGLFQTNINTILQQINVKNVNSIQYTAPGFEPTTSWSWAISHNH